MRTARRTRRGLDRRRGILRRISNAPNRPPRPASASGVLIKRPSVVEAGYMEYRPSVGLKSSGFCFFFPLPTGSRRRRGPPGGRLLREREKEGELESAEGPEAG